MTDPYAPWFHIEQPKPKRTLCYSRKDSKLVRFMVDSGDLDAARRAVERSTEARPVLAVIQGGHA